VPYTPIKETKEEKALYANIIARVYREQIDECNLTFDTMGGGTSMHMEPTRSIERTQSILRILQAVEKGKSRREAIKTASRYCCIGIHANCAPLCHCEGTYSPSSSRSPMAADGMILQRRDSIFRRGRRRKYGNGGGPNTGGRGTVGRRY
jgi:hypothetical protein